MNITRLRKVWFTISGALVAASIAVVIIFGFNLGLDFLGGLRWTIAFQTEQPVQKTDLGKFFAEQKSLTKDVQIQTTETGEFLITLEVIKDEKFQEISKNLQSELGSFEEISFRRVDPSLGASFKQKAFYAIIASLVGIVLFVAYAFRKIPKAISPWRFGTVAIIALFHDVLIILGIFVVLGALVDIELDLQFITALLATLGFSVNDTIVILDRVRENIRLQKSHETFADTIEKSIQQTLYRSINTSVSTLLPLLALLFLGANAIFYFILALTIGIFVGTYSSIFLAAPLLVTWKNWVDRA